MGDILMELQSKYINKFESMNKDDLKTFLTILESDTNSSYRNERIERIKRRIAEIERREGVEKERRVRWLRLAEEDKAIKDGWLAIGATFRNVESMCVWEYEGEPFYRWFSGVNVEDEIKRARKADRELRRLIEGQAIN